MYNPHKRSPQLQRNPQRQTAPVLQRQVSPPRAAAPVNKPVSKPKPAAPPVYRPQSVPKVLQKKPVAAPPVYRPAPKKIVQPKVATIAQPRQAQAAAPPARPAAPSARLAAPSARPTPRAPGILQKKNAPPRGPMPQVVQRHTSHVIQRLGEAEIAELRIFYDREIREIGSPTGRQNRVAFAQASQALTLPAAKQHIRDHIAAWKRNLERESREPAQPGPSLRSPAAGMAPVSSSDLSSTFGPHTPRPSPLNQKQKQHFTYGMYKTLNAVERLYQVADMASDFGVTLFELQKRANTMALERAGVLDYIDRLAAAVRNNTLDADDISGSARLSLNGLVGVYYRYHKFAGDPTSQQFVFGGFFNKSEITTSEQGKGIKNYFKSRHEAMETLSTGSPLEKTLAMEAAQANAKSTPFIATTSNRAYAQQLFGEYPPSAEQGQRAAIVTIIGPSCNAFDFEREFAALDRGFRLFNLRTVSKRSKDREQFEFGLPDIFIPVRGRSPFGFVIAKIQML